MNINMDVVISGALSGVLSGLVCLWVGYRLGRGGEALDRRRQFKTRMRVLAGQAGECAPMYLWQVHERHREEVRELCAGISDDVRRSKRGKFKRLARKFLALEDADLEAPQEVKGKDAQERERFFRRACDELEALLDELADAV